MQPLEGTLPPGLFLVDNVHLLLLTHAFSMVTPCPQYPQRREKILTLMVDSQFYLWSFTVYSIEKLPECFINVRLLPHGLKLETVDNCESNANQGINEEEKELVTSNRTPGIPSHLPHPSPPSTSNPHGGLNLS